MTIRQEKLFSVNNSSSIGSLKGKYRRVLTSFVKNGEIRPSLSYKIILAQREERNQLNS